jgi:integrase
LVEPTILHGLQAVGGLRRGRSEARENQPVRPVDDSVVDAVRPHVSRQVWAMIQLQRLTGMRSGETVIMRACDIEMDGRIWVYRPAAHKTEHHGHQRVVELGPKAQAVIRPFLQRDITSYLFSPTEAEAERRAGAHRRRRTPLTCGNRPGTNRARSAKRPPQQRYTTASYRRAIERGIERAFQHPELSAVPQCELTEEQREELRRWHHQHHWHPHQLRHTFATRVRKQYGLETARILLGQATIAAAEIYAEAERSRAAEIAAKIG